MRKVLSLAAVVGGMLWATACTAPASAAATKPDGVRSSQNWYSPASRPGMVSRYDIHRKHATYGVRKAVRKSARIDRLALGKAAAAQAGLSSRAMGFYVPLTRPGMVSRYDIAGWHARKPSGLEAAASAAVAVRARSAQPVAEAAEKRPAPSWYIPSARPGMIDRYDINNAHRRKS